MPEAGTESKSPKTRRPLSKGHTNLPRHVHFDGANPKTRSTSTNTSNPPEEPPPRNTQPESHPQVGQPSLPNLNRPPSGQWYTSADPTRSVHLPGTQPAHSQAHHLPHHPHAAYFHHPQAQGVSYIGGNMGDYQNCVPPPTGVNFQPPVPDTTFGPIPHVYVPRFDGAAMFAGGAVHQPVGAAAPMYGLQPSMAPMHQQPIMFNGQAYVPVAPGIPGQPMMSGTFGGSPPMMATPNGFPGVGGPMQFMPGNPPPPPPPSTAMPDVSGMGRTPHEETLRQVEFAYQNRLFEPQDFKPADDDPSRFYYVREVDGNWTQRNRFSIDHMGDCRWYVTDEGWFYAVRLPD